MNRNIVIVLLGIFVLSCEEHSEIIKSNNQIINISIDTLIFSTDTFRNSFGYFGDEEGISIIEVPENAKSCEILNKHWEERILQYIPGDKFLGIDSLKIKTERGSDGAGPSTEIDSVLIIIKVVKDEFHQKLIGKWIWIVSCGGFTGSCWYPTDNLSTVVEFRNDMVYNSYDNESLVSTKQYHFSDSFLNGNVLTYEISFSDNYDTYFWFSGDKLNIQGGDFIEEYERIDNLVPTLLK